MKDKLQLQETPMVTLYQKSKRVEEYTSSSIISTAEHNILKFRKNIPKERKNDLNPNSYSPLHSLKLCPATKIMTGM